MRTDSHLRRVISDLIIVGNLSVAIALLFVTWTFVDAVFLRDLPYERATDLVLIDRLPIFEFSESQSFYDEWKSASRTLDDAFLYAESDSNVFQGSGGMRVRAVHSSSNLFTMLGVKPVVGRLFEATDEDHDAFPVAIVSVRMWKSLFGGRTDIGEEFIRLDGVRLQIVGVVDSLGVFPQRIDVWTASIHSSRLLAIFGAQSRFILGRLRKDSTLSAVNLEQSQWIQEWSPTYQASPTNIDQSQILVSRLSDHLIGNLVGPSIVLVGLTISIAIIALLNVTLLLGVGVYSRKFEIATRIALGASFWDLSRVIAFRVSCLVAAGAVLGTIGAIVAVQLLRANLAFVLPAHATIDPSPRLVIVGCVVPVVVALISLPYSFWLVSSMNDTLLKDLSSAYSEVRGFSSRVGIDLLLFGQIVLFTTLVVLALSGVQSIVGLTRVPMGYNTDNVMFITVSRPQVSNGNTSSDRLAIADRFAAIGDLVASLSYVRDVGGSDYVPGIASSVRLRQIEVPHDEGLLASPISISPGFFSTLRVTLIEGRDFSVHDDDTGGPVCIVSRTFARKAWPNVSAVGQEFGDGRREYQVVGVVDDLRIFGPLSAPPVAYYVPLSQSNPRSFTYVARLESNALGLVEGIRSLVLEHSMDQVVERFGDLSLQVAGYLLPLHQMVGASLVIAVVSFVLVASGIYCSVMDVTLRSRRYSMILLAIGASHGRVIQLALVVFARSSLLGVVCGAVAGSICVRLTKHYIYGIDQPDPLTLSAALVMIMIVVMIVALAASCKVISGRPASVLKQY